MSEGKGGGDEGLVEQASAALEVLGADGGQLTDEQRSALRETVAQVRAARADAARYRAARTEAQQLAEERAQALAEREQELQALRAKADPEGERARELERLQAERDAALAERDRSAALAREQQLRAAFDQAAKERKVDSRVAWALVQAEKRLPGDVDPSTDDGRATVSALVAKLHDEVPSLRTEAFPKSPVGDQGGGAPKQRAATLEEAIARRIAAQSARPGS